MIIFFSVLFVLGTFFYLGSQSLLRRRLSRSKVVQGLGTCTTYFSHSGFYARGTLGRYNNLCTRRDALVSRAGSIKRHTLADIGLSLSTTGAQSRARRTLSKALQALSGQQEALPRTRKRSKDT